jgi:hypothetical protein
MKGSMKGQEGKFIPATGKTAKLEFCTVATWKNGEIVEESYSTTLSVSCSK